MEPKNKNLLKFLLLILLIGIAVYTFKFSPYAEKITISGIKDYVLGFGALSFLVYIAIYAFGTLVSIPGTILTFVGAILFGTWLGTGLTVIGATIGASAAFFAARHLGRDFVQGLMKGKFKTFQKQVEKHAFKGILFLRLVPAFPFIAINYGSGLVKMKFMDYFWATFIGIIPGTFVYTYLFSTWGDAVLMGDFTWKQALTPQLLLPLGLFALLLIAPLAVKKLKKA